MHFGKIADVVEAAVMYKGKTSRGFGFVSFRNINIAEKVCACGPHVIDSRVVDVKFAVPKEHVQSNKIFIGGLPHDCEMQVILDYFSKYGTIVDGSIQRDRRTNRSRGFAFIRFLRSSSVELVMKHRDQHMIEGKWVDVKRAIAEGEVGAVGSARAAGNGAASAREGSRGSTNTTHRVAERAEPAQAQDHTQMAAQQFAQELALVHHMALLEAQARVEARIRLEAEAISAQWGVGIPVGKRSDEDRRDQVCTLEWQPQVAAPPGLDIFEDDTLPDRAAASPTGRSPLAPRNHRNLARVKELTRVTWDLEGASAAA